MDSNTLKTEALCWMRFIKKMEFIATECGGWSADVLGVCDNFSIEIEVKVSKSDLKREFQNKASKHFLYNNGGTSRHVPNYFYFYVPLELEEAALALIAEHSPKAGLAVYENKTDNTMDGKRTRISKRPGKLHDRKPSDALKRVVLLRMGSELCGRHIAHRDLMERLHSLIDGMAAQVIEKISSSTNTIDWIEAVTIENPRE